MCVGRGYGDEESEGWVGRYGYGRRAVERRVGRKGRRRVRTVMEVRHRMGSGLRWGGVHVCMYVCTWGHLSRRGAVDGGVSPGTQGAGLTGAR